MVTICYLTDPISSNSRAAYGGKKSVAASEGYFCIPKCVLLTMQYTDLLLNLSVLAIFT